MNQLENIRCINCHLILKKEFTSTTPGVYFCKPCCGENEKIYVTISGHFSGVPLHLITYKYSV